jgi:acetylornithine deacetylase/succinyl-diaminopimelate desuccinylase-like protein
VESPVHMPNEFISIEDLMFNTKMMADAILALAAE